MPNHARSAARSGGRACANHMRDSCVAPPPARTRCTARARAASWTKRPAPRGRRGVRSTQRPSTASSSSEASSPSWRRGVHLASRESACADILARAHDEAGQRLSPGGQLGGNAQGDVVLRRRPRHRVEQLVRDARAGRHFVQPGDVGRETEAPRECLDVHPARRPMAHDGRHQRRPGRGLLARTRHRSPEDSHAARSGSVSARSANRSGAPCHGRPRRSA